MFKVYYVGDWAILTGPVFAETPFHQSPKGLEIFNYGIWLKDALEKKSNLCGELRFGMGFLQQSWARGL
jgi:hypothetical protein